MKAAILDTEDYHATMREIVDSSLRRRMYYVPQRMESDKPLLSVYPSYLDEVDVIMNDLSNDDWLTNCNPRSPYLLLVWLLIGSDNKYRICQYFDDVQGHQTSRQHSYSHGIRRHADRGVYKPSGHGN